MHNLYYLGYTDFEELADNFEYAFPIYLLGHVHQVGGFEHGRDELLITTAQVLGNTLHYAAVPVQEYKTMGFEPVDLPKLNHTTKFPYYMAKVQGVVQLFEAWLRRELGPGIDLRHALPWIPDPKVYANARMVIYDKATDSFALREAFDGQGE